MCEFCKAREYEIKAGNEVTCQVYVYDFKEGYKWKYLLFELKYCPVCGKDLRVNE